MKLSKKVVIFAIAIVVIISIVAIHLDNLIKERNFPLPNYKKGAVLIEKTDGEIIRFNVEIAETEEQMRRGLMFRRSIPPDYGMLFLFKKPERAGFWMKNTFIPLDIIFIRPDGTISSISNNTKPFDENVILSKEEVLSVLEIKGGESANRGIKEGNRVTYSINNFH